MNNEVITQSNIIPAGTEVSFGTLTEPHEFAQIIVNANGSALANGTIWRLYSITAAGAALIKECEFQKATLSSKRLLHDIADGALIELRGFNPFEYDTLAITASLVGYDPKCCAENTGPSGPEGEPGPTGPAGDGGTGLSEYAYFWQTVEEVAGTIAANNGKALFSTASTNNTAGLSTVASSGDITVEPGGGGIYAIHWMVAGAEPNAFGVFIDGALAAGSVYGSGAGTQQNSGSTLLTLADGEVVSLRTVDCAAAVTLQLAGTTNVAQICASILFEKLS